MDSLFLRHLTLIIVAAAVCMLLARQAKLPSIVAWLVAGRPRGPATGWGEITESLDALAAGGFGPMRFVVGVGESSSENASGAARTSSPRSRRILLAQRDPIGQGIAKCPLGTPIDSILTFGVRLSRLRA